jgi:hypothetical protein
VRLRRLLAAAQAHRESWMGVNHRNFGLDLLNSVRIRRLDGAARDGGTR